MAIQIDPKAAVQEVSLTNNDLKFQTPFAMSVCGPSQCGKSEFIVKLVENRHLLFDVDFERIVYCAPESLALRHNPIFQRIKNSFATAELNIGLPDLLKLNLTLTNNPVLLIVEDLMKPFLENEDMLNLLTAGVHHHSVTTVFSMQDYYHHSRHRLTFMKNCAYRVIFYNRLDLTEIRTISVQIAANPKFLIESFEFLKSEYPDDPPYIIFDGSGKSPLKNLFVRSRIFPLFGTNEIKPI